MWGGCEQVKERKRERCGQLGDTSTHEGWERMGGELDGWREGERE